MNILGIGPLEILMVLVIVLLVLGPDDLQKTGRTVGQWINKVTRSEGWIAISSISKEIRGLPTRLAREAQLEELKKLKEEVDIEKQIGSISIDELTEEKKDKKASEAKEEKPAEAPAPQSPTAEAESSTPEEAAE